MLLLPSPRLNEIEMGRSLLCPCLGPCSHSRPLLPFFRPSTCLQPLLYFLPTSGKLVPWSWDGDHEKGDRWAAATKGRSSTLPFPQPAVWSENALAEGAGWAVKRMWWCLSSLGWLLGCSPSSQSKTPPLTNTDTVSPSAVPPPACPPENPSDESGQLAGKVIRIVLG